MSVWAADYPEKQIKSLPREVAHQMALHCLAGWRYSCGPLTAARNRWWSVTDPNGKKMGSTCGGLHLGEQVRKVQNEIIRRATYSGTLAKAYEEGAAQLGKQLGPKAGLVRRAR